MDELTYEERLAVMKTFHKAMGDAIADAERGMRNRMEELYAETGADRITAKSASGGKLFTLSISGGGESVECVPGMEREFESELANLGLAEVTVKPSRDWRKSFAVDEKSGAVIDPNGCIADYLRVVPKASTTRITMAKPEQVRDAIGAYRLGKITVAGLLE